MMKSQVCFCGFKQDQESSYQMASDQLGRKYTSHAKMISPTICTCISGFLCFSFPIWCPNGPTGNDRWDRSPRKWPEMFGKFLGPSRGQQKTPGQANPVPAWGWRYHLSCHHCPTPREFYKSTRPGKAAATWKFTAFPPTSLTLKFYLAPCPYFQDQECEMCFFLMLSLQSPLGIALINHCHSLQLVGVFNHFEKY